LASRAYYQRVKDTEEFKRRNRAKVQAYRQHLKVTDPEKYKLQNRISARQHRERRQAASAPIERLRPLEAIKREPGQPWRGSEANKEQARRLAEFQRGRQPSTETLVLLRKAKARR
jgi:hypothetical protein